MTSVSENSCDQLDRAAKLTPPCKGDCLHKRCRKSLKLREDVVSDNPSANAIDTVVCDTTAVALLQAVYT